MSTVFLENNGRHLRKLFLKYLVINMRSVNQFYLYVTIFRLRNKTPTNPCL